MKTFGTLMVLGLLLVSLASAQVIGDTLTMRADEPGSPPGVAAGTVGAAGNITLYYWVAARYAQGLFTPAVPIAVGATVGVAGLSGTDYVQIGWRAAPFATGYYVIRTTTPVLTGGACTACVVLTNSTALAFSDQGGATTNYPPAGVGTVSQANFNMILENADEATPYLRTTLNGVAGRIPITTGTGTGVVFPGSVTLGGALIGANGAIFTNDENAFRWRTISEYFVGELATAYTDWSARVGSVQGFGSRISSDFATTTFLKGGDFRVQSLGGATGNLIGSQNISTTGAGTTTLDEVWGTNGIVFHNTGTVTNMYGSVGEVNVGAAGAIVATGTATGVLGLYIDAAGINLGTNFTASVMGAIQDLDTPGPDGAVVALLRGDTIRTAGNSPNAAFKVMDLTTTPNVSFNYGLDLYYVNAPYDNTFNNADIRGQNQSILENEAALLWRSNAEFRVSAAAGAFLDWSARTDTVIQGFRSRIETDMATATTTAYGGLFEVQAGAATAGGFFSGIRARAVTDAGLTGSDIFDGVYGEMNPTDGLIGSGYGVFGIANIDGTTTAGLNMLAAGVKGDWDDAVGLTAATNYTAGVMGFISDTNVVGPLGAVVAVLEGGGVRQAAQSPTSAFRVVDLNEQALTGFDYGFDAYWNDGVVTDSTVFNVADIRGQNQSTLNNEAAFLWTSQSEYRVAAAALAYLDWSARAGSIQAFGSRLSSDFATTTFLKGGDFRVQSLGGAAGNLIGSQNISTTGAGTTTLDEVWGTNGIVFHNTGTVTNMYGSVGEINIGAAGAIVATGTATGVLGLYIDAADINIGTNFTSSVMGAIQDLDTAGPDGAFVALLRGDTIRTAGNSPPAAFKVIDRTTTPNVNFDFGLDLYYLENVTPNAFNNAAIRGQSLDMLDNAAAGYWTLARGSGNFTGFTLEGTAFANLPAAANGTMMYCTNCDPAGGAGFIACATGGGSSGALAVRLNGVWDCGSR